MKKHLTPIEALNCLLNNKSILVQFYGQGEPKRMPSSLVKKWGYIRKARHEYFYDFPKIRETISEKEMIEVTCRKHYYTFKTGN